MNTRLVLLFVVFAVGTEAVRLSFKSDPFWHSYKKSFSKSYKTTEEEERRYKAFSASMARAAVYNEHNPSATYGMTPVSDRFPEELFTHLEVPSEDPTFSREKFPFGAAQGIDYFDARDKGLVPPIRNQGFACGSCYAFASALSMEVSRALYSHTGPQFLSVQQMIDCSKTDHGCTSGWPFRTLGYAQEGIESEVNYPYVERANRCRHNSSKSVARVVRYAYTEQNETAMRDAVFTYGSLVVCLDADKMQSYVNGIMNGDDCPGPVNHAVNIVGWGKTGDVRYWIVRNTWGEEWGEQGYMRLVLGKNACLVEKYPIYVKAAAALH